MTSAAVSSYGSADYSPFERSGYGSVDTTDLREIDPSPADGYVSFDVFGSVRLHRVFLALEPRFVVLPFEKSVESVGKVEQRRLATCTRWH